MLEDLGQIDWSKIQHAYGPAADIPAHLQALAYGLEEDRRKALWELHGNIWHQGTIYEATAYAIPFLLELVRFNVPDTVEILSLLTLIAHGSSYLEQHRSLMQTWTPADQEQLQREQSWVAAAKRELTAAAGFLFDLTKSSDQKIRELSLYLLGTANGDVEPGEVIERILGTDS